NDTRRRSRGSAGTCDLVSVGARRGPSRRHYAGDRRLEVRELFRDSRRERRAIRRVDRGIGGVPGDPLRSLLDAHRDHQLAGGRDPRRTLVELSAAQARHERSADRNSARGDLLSPASRSPRVRVAARLHGGSLARRDRGRRRRRSGARAAGLSHRVRSAGVRALLPECDGRSGAQVVRHVRRRARVAAPLGRVRAVLFDWGDTLFHAPHAPEVISSYGAERGVKVTDAEARGLWDELWAAGNTPEEIAKGRDLSPDAHRRVWTALFARADRVAPGLSRALYERVMDPNSWVPFADTPRVLRALRDRGLRIGVVSN